jgi:hypothetical protein
MSKWPAKQSKIILLKNKLNLQIWCDESRNEDKILSIYSSRHSITKYRYTSCRGYHVLKQEEFKDIFIVHECTWFIACACIIKGDM